MRKLMPALMAVVLWSTGALAQDVRIEHDAILGSDMKKLANLQEVLNAFALKIRLNGWRCDSISVAQKFIFSRGFTVICNDYAYEYEIRDRGGQWVATLK